MDLRAILVCVDYHDLLRITLPWNRHHFAEVWVVTAPRDLLTVEIAEQNDCNVFLTNAFWERGAKFNKWLALERGLDQMLRHGWICNMDADVLWPKEIPPFDLKIGELCTPLRRMHDDFNGDIPPEHEWSRFPMHRNVNEWAGYSQIFHASDPVLGPRPWHEIDWIHAGGADSFFQRKWHPANKVRPDFEVLHLGPAGQNWFGRATKYLDGTTEPESEQRLKANRSIWDQRRRNRKDGADQFMGEKLHDT